MKPLPCNFSEREGVISTLISNSMFAAFKMGGDKVV